MAFSPIAYCESASFARIAKTEVSRTRKSMRNFPGLLRRSARFFCCDVPFRRRVRNGNASLATGAVRRFSPGRALPATLGGRSCRSRDRNALCLLPCFPRCRLQMGLQCIKGGLIAISGRFIPSHFQYNASIARLSLFICSIGCNEVVSFSPGFFFPRFSSRGAASRRKSRPPSLFSITCRRESPSIRNSSDRLPQRLADSCALRATRCGIEIRKGLPAPFSISLIPPLTMDYFD